MLYKNIRLIKRHKPYTFIYYQNDSKLNGELPSAWDDYNFSTTKQWHYFICYANDLHNTDNNNNNNTSIQANEVPNGTLSANVTTTAEYHFNAISHNK